MSRFQQWVRLGILAVLLILFPHTPAPTLYAQGDPPPPPPPGEPEQPDMVYQPPADADDLTDFLPPDGLFITAPPLTTTLVITTSPPITPTPPRPITTTVSVTATTAVTLTEVITQLVSFEEGQIAVVFEEETFSEQTEIQLTKVASATLPLTATNTISDPVQSLVLQTFQLDVVQDGEVVAGDFAKPVRLIVDLHALTPGLNPVYDGNFFLAYKDKEVAGLWHEVPLDIYQETGLISAEVMHFSEWVAGARPERWSPSLVPPTVSEFSGAASYGYPMEVPPGRHGLQPSVALSYSSRSIDGAIQDQEAGDVANGWSLSQIAIMVNGPRIREWAGPLYIYHPNVFSLVLNGTSYDLVPIGDDIANGTMQYVAKDAPGLRVWRYLDTNLPTDGLYWVVTTQDGTQYRLGYTTDSEEYQQGPLWYATDHAHEGKSNYISAMAWNVDTITDAFGNQMQYSYYTRSETETITTIGGSGTQYSITYTTRTSRLKDITYNYPNRTSLPVSNTVGRLGGTPGSAVKFRATGDNDTSNTFTNPISSVYIFHGNMSTPIKEYRIAAEDVQMVSPGCVRPEGHPRPTHSRIVNGISLHTGVDADVNTSAVGNTLPAVTFEYSYLRHHIQGVQDCFFFPYMYRVHNGYGGTTTFNYVSDNRSVGDYIYKGGPDSTTWPKIGYTYSVGSVLSNDGRNPDVLTTYTYSQPCYNQGQPVTAPAIQCPTPNTAPDYGTIVGYQTTTVKHYDYNGTTMLNQQVTTFSQNAATTIGKPTEIQVKDGSGILLGKTTHAYTTVSINGLANMFTYINETKNYQYNSGEGSPTLSTKTTYEYNITNQGGSQYGNLTHIRTFADAGAATPYSTTVRWYYPNTTIWLVGQMGQEAIYEGSATLIRYTRQQYDNAAFGTPPTQGALTRSRLFAPITCAEVTTPPGAGVGCVHAYASIDTATAYDLFGNAVSLTNYSDYGYHTYDINWGELVNTLPGTARTTTIAYDPTYNLYPLSTTFVPLNQTTTFQIYGFNGVSLSGFQKQPGLLKQVTGPDSVTTKYEYDPFGRLHAIYDANTTYQNDDFAGFEDTDPWNGDPVTLYRYWDNTWNNATTFLNPAPPANAPFVISQQQRPGSFPQPANSSSGFAFNDQTFFDGFGRPIQTRSIWHWVEGQSLSREIISSTAYGANGQVSCQTAPYDVPFYAERDVPNWPYDVFVNEACTSKPHTATTYDALGRPSIITAADASQTKYYYGIGDYETPGVIHQRTSVVDANSHAITQGYNALGQLAYVHEYEGTASPYTPSAHTRYAYDTMGNLTDVWDALNNTHMTYDKFGRKIGMTDPDMGNWTYAYDAVGNLTEQRDANLTRLCFKYDELNRLTHKRHDSDNDGCESGDTQLAYYAYYTSGVGKVGQLQEIRWSSSGTQNKETFNYDSLGRLTNHTRIVDNRSYAMNYTGFDALHRPTSRTLTWPNANTDTVTVTYDREGENTMSGGGSSLVTAVGYNDMGQLKRVALNNGLTTWYGYLGYSASGNNDAYDATWGQFGKLWRICTAPAGSNRCTYANRDTTPIEQRLDLRYAYDSVGNVTSILDKMDSSQIQNFGYDHLNRLTSASTNGVGTAQYAHTYSYNKIGNLTNYNGAGYTYGSSLHKHAVTNANGVNFTYDLNGNMTLRDASGTANDYTQNFNVENELSSVVNNGSTTTFAYDAAGMRSKAVSPSGVTTYYPLPGYEEEVNGSTTTRRITYSAAGQAIALRVQIVSGSNTLYYLHSDHLGSTSLATTTGGSLIAGSTSRYYPFGDWRTEPTANLTDRGFTGHMHNNIGSGTDDIGLVYMQARWYLPYINRFVSADSIVPDPANPQSFNRYSYTRNNPLRFTDPTGHRECEDGPNNCAPYVSPFLEALYRAWLYYENNFVKPFEGKQNLSQEFGPTQWSDFHDGNDYSGDFTVRAPASGTVTEAGPDSPAGIWRIGRILRDENGNQVVREWSNFDTNTEGSAGLLSVRSDGGLLEPQQLLATGEWEDLEPSWSHTQGTVIRIDHGHNLETVYYHTNPSIAADTTVNQGEVLGVTANNGWSTGTHLHYTVNFTYNGRSIPLNPLAPPASIQHLLTP